MYYCHTLKRIELDHKLWLKTDTTAGIIKKIRWWKFQCRFRTFNWSWLSKTLLLLIRFFKAWWLRRILDDDRAEIAFIALYTNRFRSFRMDTNIILKLNFLLPGLKNSKLWGRNYKFIIGGFVFYKFLLFVGWLDVFTRNVQSFIFLKESQHLWKARKVRIHAWCIMVIILHLVEKL
jgi:hypothetical protein